MATEMSTPRVIITEQPTSAAVRYRYKCESRFAGKISGETSTAENKTFPTIKVVGYQGNAKVIVSCVTKDLPFRPHPHSLVGREGCKDGICTMNIPPTTMSVSFTNLGIQCARHRDIDHVLNKRHNEVKVDPFNTGFNHRRDSSSLGMNVVRLCFQVFIENSNGKCVVPLQPVVSEPIFDVKAKSKLVICRLSECVSPVDGGKKDIYLLCKKLIKNDITVRFYEGEDEDNPKWEGFPDFLPTQIHEQTALWFRAPPYKDLNITEPIQVFIQLMRPSDGATSEPRPFQYLPIDAEPGMLKRKRLKFGNDPRRHILLDLQTKLQSASPHYNIPPTPEHFRSLELNEALVIKPPTSNVNQFVFPINGTIPSTSHQPNSFKNHILSQDEKILNSMPIDSYIPSHVQNMESTSLTFQNFAKPENVSPGLFSPLHENIKSPTCVDLVGNSVKQPNVDYLSMIDAPVLPHKFNGATSATTSTYNQIPYHSIQQMNKEKVKNAIRAKCKSLQNAQQMEDVSVINNIPIHINQLELRNEINFRNDSNTINYSAIQGGIQNNFGQHAINENYGNFNNLLDVDFEQLENLLVSPEEDQYNSINIPMNAMTISDTSYNLSGLLSMDSSQLPTTISSEQLDNLLAII